MDYYHIRGYYKNLKSSCVWESANHLALDTIMILFYFRQNLNVFCFGGVYEVRLGHDWSYREAVCPI